MWIFTSNGFISVVAHKDKPGHLMVRARNADHLTAIFPRHKITTTPDGDYRFRCTVKRQAAAKAVARLLADVDYTNFKDSIEEAGYAHMALRCWSAANGYQEDRHPRPQPTYAEYPEPVASSLYGPAPLINPRRLRRRR